MSATSAPLSSRLCGFGLCEMTYPFFTFREKTCVTLPTRQLPASTARSAAFNASPVTSGTTQASSKVAVTDSAALIVTSQLPIPEQPAPDQPANDEPRAAVAVKMTSVPLG